WEQENLVSLKKIDERETEFYFEIRENQKYERSGIKIVALKYLENYQNIEYINSAEALQSMILPFTQHVDLRFFLNVNKKTFTWDVLFLIPFQFSSGLRFIHDSKLSGNIFGVVQYQAPEICKRSPHT
ncbi:hypothetical protein G9A89_000156, partial [Geosiphon pyriformis]